MLVLGHRGVNTPESGCTQNSLPAFNLALRDADGFETDACLSADGEVFLIHPDRDNQINGLLNPASKAIVGQKRFDQLSNAVIQSLRLEKGEPIPSLQETLELVGRNKGKIINIELKSMGVVHPVIKILRACFENRILQPEAVVLSSFDHAMLMVARQELPHVKVDALFAYEDEAGLPLYPWFSGGEARYATINQSCLSEPRLQEIQPDWLVMPETMLTMATARIAERYFPKAGLVGWTVSEARNFDFSASIERIKALPKGKVVAMIVDDPVSFVAGYRKSGL